MNDIFRENSPMGSTILTPVLEDIFTDYRKRKAAGTTQPNGQIVMIVTDGCPEDEAKVAKSIVNFTKTLDNGDDEFGISFMQIGKDTHATEFLRRLDDNLEKEGAKFDIVDCKTIDEVERVGLMECLTAALTD